MVQPTAVAPQWHRFVVWGLGIGVWGLGFGVWGLGFGDWGLGFGVWGLEFGDWCLEFSFLVLEYGFKLCEIRARIFARKIWCVHLSQRQQSGCVPGVLAQDGV